MLIKSIVDVMYNFELDAHLHLEDASLAKLRT